MKTGCAKFLLMLGALGAAWFTIFRLWFPMSHAIIGSLVAGFGALMIIGGIQNAFKAFFNAGRLADVSSGALKDGTLVTIAGRIRATGPTLRAPFSQRSCVLYKYDVARSSASFSRSDDHSLKAFSGFALTPSVIEAPNVSVRLLGFPELEGFGDETRDSSTDRANARAYVKSTQFEDMKGLAAIGKVWSLVKEQVTDDDGTVRKDLRMAADSEDTSDGILTEEIVVSGDQVCASGVYSAAKGGIVSDLSKGLNKLVKGDAVRSASSMRGQAIGQLIGGTIFGVMMIGFTLLFLLAETPEPGRTQLQAFYDSLRGGGPIERKTLDANHSAVLTCNIWLQNVQREDRSALYGLSSNHLSSYFDKIKFDQWKAERPVSASLISGTSIGDEAVVVMGGTRPDGTAVDGTYKLDRIDGTWKVREEHWAVVNR